MSLALPRKSFYLFIAGKGSACASRILYPRDSPGWSTGVGCHDLLQGIFLTQGSNPSPVLQADSLPRTTREAQVI